MKLCRIYRTVASFSLDTARPRPRRVERHLQQCPECRQQLEAERALHERLIAEADGERLPVPPFLDARILAHLRTPATAGCAPSHPRLRRVRWAPAVACAALLVGGLWLLRPPTPAPQPPVVEVIAPPPEAPVFEMASLGLTTRRDLRSLSTTFEQPLEGELQLAVNDARQAAVSLAECLLPEAAAQALLGRAERP